MAGVELGSAFISVGLGTNKLGPEIKKAFSGVDANGADAGKSAGKGFRLGFAGIATAAIGALGIGTFLKGAVAEASGLGESINAVNVVFGKASAGVQQLGKESAKSLGLSNLEFNNLAVRFSSFADTIAGPGGDVTATLKSMTGRASDFASVMNLDVAEAAQLFQSGLAGESEPLRAFGIDMSAAAVEAFALEEGIAKSASSMTEAQKVQARYGLLMKQTAQTQGDFANTSNSLANQTRILSSSWKNTQAAIGTLFLPVLEKAVGFIVANVMPNIDKLVASLGSGGLAGAFAPIMAVAGPIFSSLAASFGPLIPQVMQLVSSFSPLGLLFQVLTPILPMLATAFTQIAGTIAEVLAIVIPLVSSLASHLVPIVVELVSAILPPLAAVFGELVAAVGPFVSQIASALIPIILALMPVVVNVFNTVAAVITSVMQIVMGVIQTVTGIISGNWSQVWQGIQNIFAGIWSAIGAVASGAMAHLGAVVTGGIGLVVGYFGGLPGQILGALGNLGGLLLNAGKQILDGFLSGLRAGFESVKNFVGGIGQWIADNKGPKAYDLALLVPAGGWIMDGLESGIEKSLPSLQRTLGGVSATIAAGVTGSNYSPAYTPALAGGAGSSAGVSAPQGGAIERIVLDVGGEQVFARIVRNGERKLVRA